MPSLIIKNLHVSAAGKKILSGVSVAIRFGQTHVLMGPNGSGKSTLATAIFGKPGLKITNGEIFFGKSNLRKLTPDRIAALGIGLAFQQPVTVSGVNLPQLVNALFFSRDHIKKLNPDNLIKTLTSLAKKLELNEELLERSLNDGFSGGEKKKAEILQILSQKPKMIILDEIDSGLDTDSLKIISAQIRRWQKDRVSILLITHNARLLKSIQIDRVHAVKNGKIVKSGNKEFGDYLQKNGYKNV